MSSGLRPNRRTGDWESPQVPHLLWRNRGIFSLWRLAEWRCWRPETSETDTQQSARYLGARYQRHRWTVTTSLYAYCLVPRGESRNLRRGGAVPPLHSSPLPFLSLPSPSPSRYRPLKPARGSGGALWAPPAGSGVEPKTNLVHSKSVTKPLVAIILNILSTIVHVLEEIKIAMVSP